MVCMCACVHQAHVPMRVHSYDHVLARAYVHAHHTVTHKPHQRLQCRKLRQHSFKEEAETDRVHGAGGTQTADAQACTEKKKYKKYIYMFTPHMDTNAQSASTATVSGNPLGFI